MGGQQQQGQQQKGQQQQQNAQFRGADADTLRKTLDQLQQAIQEMRNAASSQQAGTPQGQAEAQRAHQRSARRPSRCCRVCAASSPAARWMILLARLTIWRGSSRISKASCGRHSARKTDSTSSRRDSWPASGRMKSSSSRSSSRRCRTPCAILPPRSARRPPRCATHWARCSSRSYRATCSAMANGFAAAWASMR